MRDNYDDRRPWYGFDLDGCAAKSIEPFDAGRIGEPIASIVDLMYEMMRQSKRIKIFTARVCETGQLSHISGHIADRAFADWQHSLITLWNKRNLGRDIEVTCIKDFLCLEIYDDRAWRVAKNTGKIVDTVFHEWRMPV